MSNVGGALGNAGKPISITHNGREYAIRGVDAGMVLQLERQLIQQEVELRAVSYDICIKHKLMTQEEAILKIGLFASELKASGKYAFGSEAMNIAMFGKKVPPTDAEMAAQKLKSPEQIAKEMTDIDRASLMSKFCLFALMMDCTVDEVLDMFGKKPVELFGKIDLALAMSLPDNSPK